MNGDGVTTTVSRNWSSHRERGVCAVPAAQRDLLTCSRKCVNVLCMCSFWRVLFYKNCWVVSNTLIQTLERGVKKNSHLIQYGVCRVEEIKGLKRGDAEVKWHCCEGRGALLKAEFLREAREEGTVQWFSNLFFQHYKPGNWNKKRPFKRADGRCRD